MVCKSLTLAAFRGMGALYILWPVHSPMANPFGRRLTITHGSSREKMYLAHIWFGCAWWTILVAPVIASLSSTQPKFIQRTPASVQTSCSDPRGACRGEILRSPCSQQNLPAALRRPWRASWPWLPLRPSSSHLGCTPPSMPFSFQWQQSLSYSR